MGATFNRLKTWVAETLTAADLNAEIDNILDNFTPAGMDDYSTNVTEMQTQTDAGEVGTESQATSMAGELARIRFELAELKGETYWYTRPVITLSAINTILGSSSLPPSRLISGETTGNSSQSYLLTPQGSGNGNDVVINGTAVDLIYSVDSAEFTLSADVTIASTVAPPLSNNTATVNDASINDQDWTKWTGMHGNAIPIDAIGSEITSLNGQTAAFKLNDGSNDEYFLANPDTTNNQLKNVRRGWFFDENGADVVSIPFANNDTITLMNIAWIFLKNDNTARVTYNEPKIQGTEPGSPINGDYWYDLDNDTWKTFTGIVFESADTVFIGISIQDENSDCVVARSETFTASYVNINTLELEFSAAGILKSNYGARVGVNGNTMRYDHTQVTWDMTSNLDSGISEAASTMYFFYIKESGEPVISDIAPDDFVSTRGGLYHPVEAWRCVGQAWNGGSSVLEHVISYHSDDTGLAVAESSVSGNALLLSYWASPLMNFRLYDEADSNNAKTKVVKFPFYQALTVPSGATLGHINSAGGAATTLPDNVILHLIYQSDYATLGVSSHQWGQAGLATTTALTSGSDAGVLYSLEAYTTMPSRAVAYGTGEQTTAGTWASNLTFFNAKPFLDICRTVKSASSGSFATTATTPTSVITTPFEVTGSRDVFITMEAVGTSGSNESTFTVSRAGGSVGTSLFHIYYNSAVHRTVALAASITGASAISISIPATSLQACVPKEELPTGTQTIELRAESSSSSISTGVETTRIVVRELPYGGDL